MPDLDDIDDDLSEPMTISDKLVMLAIILGYIFIGIPSFCYDNSITMRIIFMISVIIGIALFIIIGSWIINKNETSEKNTGIVNDDSLHENTNDYSASMIDYNNADDSILDKQEK